MAFLSKVATTNPVPHRFLPPCNNRRHYNLLKCKSLFQECCLRCVLLALGQKKSFRGREGRTNTVFLFLSPLPWRRRCSKVFFRGSAFFLFCVFLGRLFFTHFSSFSLFSSSSFASFFFFSFFFLLSFSVFHQHGGAPRARELGPEPERLGQPEHAQVALSDHRSAVHFKPPLRVQTHEPSHLPEPSPFFWPLLPLTQVPRARQGQVTQALVPQPVRQVCHQRHASHQHWVPLQPPLLCV
mmetsp:Transcript_40600/g.69026  ORF Transcript_40600/g.69026 Transcript_40600/m.69026 type:complete len:240 (+) Transcript_40600:125-844(+)